MTLTNREIDLHMMIEDSLMTKLYESGIAHYPKEFGGLLVGYYSDDRKTVYIKDTLLPIKYKSSRYSFERGNEGLKISIEKYFQQQPSLFYVGEWHTHPDNPAVPSLTDIDAMNEIVNDKNVLIDSPILLILGIDKNTFYVRYYVYFKEKIYEYQTY